MLTRVVSGPTGNWIVVTLRKHRWLKNRSNCELRYGVSVDVHGSRVGAPLKPNVDIDRRDRDSKRPTLSQDLIM